MKELAKEVLEVARERGVKIVTAESCTGGMVAAAFTDIAGSSEVFERGLVTYSNEAKVEMLGVLPEVIATHGAVSEEVAAAMAEGALERSKAQLSVAITGVAGPDSSEEKPVGLVYIASALQGKKILCQEHHFEGDRAAVREQSVRVALELLIMQLQG